MKTCHVVGLLLLALAISVCGCGKKKVETTETTPVAAEPKGPDYQVFAALDKATKTGTVPFLLGDEGVDSTSCFNNIEGLTPVDASMEVRTLVEDNEKEIQKSIRSWLSDDMELNEVTVGGWDIQVEDLMMLEVSDNQLRFVEGQECISPDTGWLPEGTRAVTMMMGARTFNFTTQVPVDQDTKEEMMRSFGMENMVIESDALFVYEPAVDNAGEPMVNPDGEALYKSPDGSFISEKEVPAPEKQLMKEWVVKSEVPIFFGFRELSDKAWRKESTKDNCDVYLIWGDVTPRQPECAEFAESSFTAIKTEDGEISITVTTDGQNKGEVMAFGKTKLVQINDRILMWLSPKEIEEGALIRLNTLVLDPAPMAGDTAEDDAYAVPTKTEPEPEAKDEEDKPKKRKKKGKQSDEDMLNEYLR